ncbi:MAG: hypothetical protein ACE5OZ_04115 [Candidatus Heimdallarchaeota archaeon]
MNERINEERRRQRTTYDLKYSLPDTRSKLKQHLDIIRAYALKGQDKETSLSYKDFEGLITFTTQYVSGNNNFLHEIGMLESAKGRGQFRPTEACLNFAQALEWGDNDAAKRILHDLLKEIWFTESVRELLLVQGPASEDAILRKLGVDSSASKDQHLPALKIILDYLVYSGIIKEENGHFRLVDPVVNETQTKYTSVHSERPATHENHLKPVAVRTSDFSHNVVLGILVSSDLSEEQLRRTIRIVLDEINRYNQTNGED